MLARLLPALLLLAAVTLVLPASADPIGVGDCRKAVCAGACVTVVASCSDASDIACVGFSYQVPQCVGGSAAASTGSDADLRCLGAPCDILNAVCYLATKHWCVG